MADKDFHVDTDALKLVAERIKTLLDTANGEHGYTGGSIKEFSTATEAEMKQGLQPLVNPDNNHADWFSDNYKSEHEGVVHTYQQFIAQLQHLYTSTSTTATTYEKADGDNKKTVTNTTAGTNWGS